MLVYLSLEAPHAFCSSAFIPPSSHSPAIESSNSVSLATSLNSFQYSVIDFPPCFRFLYVILASPLASIIPNWLLSSFANPAQVSHVDGISSSIYGVIYLPASSLNRLMAYRIFSLSCPSAISKNISCTRRTAFALGYQAQNIGTHDARCVLWLVAILTCARCIRGSILIHI